MPSSVVLKGASSRHLISYSSDIFPPLYFRRQTVRIDDPSLHRTARWFNGQFPGSSALDALGVGELAIEEAVAIACGTPYQNQPNA